jgi:hypothetical protein
MSSSISPKQLITFWQTSPLLSMHFKNRQALENRCWHCYRALPISVSPILPIALGGKMQINNLVLLCSKCATAAPITTNKVFYLDWLQVYSDYSFRHCTIVHAAKLYREIYLADLGDVLYTLDIDPNHISQYLDDEKKTLCQQLGKKEINVATMTSFLWDYINAHLDSRSL